MVIIGGSSARYYRCADNHKRGTCDNNVSVREADVRGRLIDGLEDLVVHDNAVVYASKQLAARLGELEQDRAERRHRVELELARLDRHTKNLIAFLKDNPVDAEALTPIRMELSDIHEKRRRLERELLVVRAAKAQPVVLPTPKQVKAAVFDLRAGLETNPTCAREALRHLFGNGLIVMHPQDDRSYVAKTAVLPLMVIPAAKRTRKCAKPPSDESSGAPTHVVYNVGCAGAIPTLSTSEPTGIPWCFVVPKPPDRRRDSSLWKRRS